MGSRPPDFGQGPWELWNVIISYHVQEVSSKVVTFEEKLNVQVLPWNSKFSLNSLKKSTFFGNLPGKIKFLLWNCLKKSKFFWKFVWKNRNCFWPGSTTPQISNPIDATDSVAANSFSSASNHMTWLHVMPWAPKCQARIGLQLSSVARVGVTRGGNQRRQFRGVGGSYRHPDFGQGSRGGRKGSWWSWTGREILLYLII